METQDSCQVIFIMFSVSSLKDFNIILENKTKCNFEYSNTSFCDSHLWFNSALFASEEKLYIRQNRSHYVFTRCTHLLRLLDFKNNLVQPHSVSLRLIYFSIFPIWIPAVLWALKNWIAPSWWPKQGGSRGFLRNNGSLCPLSVCLSLSLFQESGTKGEGVRGGPDENLRRRFTTQAAADWGRSAALEGETGTLPESAVWHEAETQKSFILVTVIPCF